MKLRKSTVVIISLAVAGLLASVAAVTFVIDGFVEEDVRAEMRQTLDALDSDIDLSLVQFLQCFSAFAVHEVGYPALLSKDRLKEFADTFGLDSVRILDETGQVVQSFGGGTNLESVVRMFPDGRHHVEVGADFRNFSRGEFGLVLIANSCLNWPRTTDGFLLCFSCTGGHVFSSGSSAAHEGDSAESVFGDFERARTCPEGEYFEAEVYDENSLCLAMDRDGFRFVCVVPLRVLPKYREEPLWAISAVLLVMVAAFTFGAIRRTDLLVRLEGYIDGEKLRMKEDLTSAQLVQMSALPPPFPPQPAFSVSARMDPARVVGGDFYDYQTLPNGCFYVLVADVSGKGISAAMFMMRAKSVIKQSLAETGDLARGMTKANTILASHNDSKLFVTVWVGVLNPRTGTLYYVNAGHNPPIVRRANGETTSLEWVKCPPSLVMALLPDVKYPVHELTLSPGDKLFLYTDGVTEAQDLSGRLYGEARLLQTLATDAGCTIEAVRADLDEFQGKAEPADDVTMVLLEYAGTPPGSARGFPCNREVGFAESVRFLEEELTRVSCPNDIRTKFLVAYDEIGSNVVNYSGAEYFTVKVALESTPQAFTLTVSDSGRPFNPLDKSAPDLKLSLEQRTSGGFGIFITRQLMDDVIYSRDEGLNVLTLRKLCRLD